MSEQIKLGTVPDRGAQRDAIHVCVVPLMAQTDIERGEWIGLENGRAVPVDEADAIGVADPFGKAYTGRGEMLWVLLKPGTITGMRHHWAHPSFADAQPAGPNTVENDVARGFMVAFAAEVGLSYDELMSAAKTFAETGETTNKGNYLHAYEWDIPDEFWNAYEKITGNKPKFRETIFTCCPG